MSGVLGSWRVTYTPGAWLVLCGPTSAVVLEPADSSWSSLVETLWTEVVASGSIGDLAARLASYRIDTMPSFAAFFWGADGMRSLVRGSVRVVDVDTEAVVADGDGVVTWTEVGLPGVSRVRVDLPVRPDSSAYPLPLVVGAVGASSVLLDASDDALVSSPQTQAEPDDGEATLPVEPFEEEHENATTALITPAPDVEVDDTEVGTELDEPALDDTELDDTRADDTETADTETADTRHEDAETRLVPLPDSFDATQAWPPPTVDPPEEEATGPTVQAVLCVSDHPNPPGATRCRICSDVIAAQSARDVPPPVLALLRASNGHVAEVDRPVLIGRAPSPDKSQAEDPELLTVTSPSHDISRTHLEVAPSGWDLVVTDLHSTNGTVLVTPDGKARQLDPGETTVVPLGTAIELADGVSVLVDYPQ